MQGNISPRVDVRAVIESDGAILLDLEGGKYFSLNDLGARIWSHLQAGLGREPILDDLERSFGVARPTLERDYDAFVQVLAERGLIHVRP